MRTQRAASTNMSTALELIRFVWRRTYWLTPMIVMLLLLTALVIFLEASAIAPFIYALF